MYKFLNKDICPICFKYEFEKKDSSEVCPVCGWIYDEKQHLNSNITGANKRTLNEALKDYRQKRFPEECAEKEQYKNTIFGSIVGGAVGDALGYPIEFFDENEIFSRFGKDGLQEYIVDDRIGKALISDDTQMTLFTAAGMLVGDTRGCMRGIRGVPSAYISMVYIGWLRTQEELYRDRSDDEFSARDCWLLDVPELFSRRAPGNTCLSALKIHKRDAAYSEAYNPNGMCEGFVGLRLNTSKGCGGIMRVAPLGVSYKGLKQELLDKEGAEIAAITHSHSLGYMPAAVLTHILHSIVYFRNGRSLQQIVEEARDSVYQMYREDMHIMELVDIINLAIELSKNSDSDLNNINRIGEGWVAEETLGIAIYCALRHQDDFSAGVIASVNHKGDSDSTGAVTGNILGAWLGYDAIDDKWKEKLELRDVIEEIAEDVTYGCMMSEYGEYKDPAWESKYMYMHRWNGVSY